MTSAELFETYDATTQHIAVAKEELKALYATLASAGKAARRNGEDWQEAIAPYKQAIAEAEQTIAQMKTQADQEWMDAQLADSREIEAQMQAKSVQITNDITPEQMEELIPFAQEYADHKQMERETFKAESLLETVPSDEQETDNQPQAYRHSWDLQHWFYYHHICVKDRLPEEVTFEQIPLKDVPADTQCEYCYEPMHAHPTKTGNLKPFEHPIQTATAIAPVYGIDRTTLTRAFVRGKLGNAAYRSADIVLIDTGHKDWLKWVETHENQPRTKGFRKQGKEQ